MRSECCFVLQLAGMSPRLTIRASDELLKWLKDRSRRTGIGVSRFIGDHLDSAKEEEGISVSSISWACSTGRPISHPEKGFS